MAIMTKETDIRTNSAKAWLLAARPKTLSGAAVPVMIGLALAYTDANTYYAQGTFKWFPAILCVLFAFVMQIDANFINDFFDYLKGTDDIETRLGPKRACAQGWITLDAMKRAIAATTCAACAVGLPLIYYGGLEMILVGVLCVVFCFLYTTHLSYMGLGDVLVIVFFGIIPVCIPYYIELHTVTWQAIVGSLACGMVIDALLIINNYRDRDTDREAGKMTIIVRLGAKWGRRLYLLTGVGATLLNLAYWYSGHILAFILPLIYLPLHIATYYNIKKINSGRALNACLGETARNILIYGLMVSIGLLLV